MVRINIGKDQVRFEYFSGLCQDPFGPSVLDENLIRFGSKEDLSPGAEKR